MSLGFNVKDKNMRLRESGTGKSTLNIIAAKLTEMREVKLWSRCGKKQPAMSYIVIGLYRSKTVYLHDKHSQNITLTEEYTDLKRHENELRPCCA